MTTDPSGLALLSLTFLSRWPEPHSDLHTAADPSSHHLINSGVWSYQLYLFHERVLGRWGEHAHQQVKQAQARILGAERAGELSTMTAIISAAIQHSIPEMKHLVRNGGDRETAIDLTVALALLERGEQATGSQKAGAVIAEYHLAECLGRGRIRMDSAIGPLIAVLQLAQSPHDAVSATRFQAIDENQGTRI